MRIGIFGGSFNPVHYGHVGLAERAISELQLDRLLVVPANVSPFKVGVDGAKPCPWNRLELVRAAFSGMEKAVVDDREIRRGGVSYAIDTVREIAAENPDSELFFVGAEDLPGDLHRWKDYDELVKLVTFKFLPRTGESSSAIRKLFEDGGVVLNPDGKLAATVREGVLRKGGYCPCRLQKTPENFCPCAEFRAQLADPGFHGLCHCRLYLKP